MYLHSDCRKTDTAPQGVGRIYTVLKTFQWPWNWVCRITLFHKFGQYSIEKMGTMQSRKACLSPRRFAMNYRPKSMCSYQSCLTWINPAFLKFISLLNLLLLLKDTWKYLTEQAHFWETMHLHSDLSFPLFWAYSHKSGFWFPCGWTTCAKKKKVLIWLMWIFLVQGVIFLTVDQ